MMIGLNPGPRARTVKPYINTNIIIGPSISVVILKPLWPDPSPSQIPYRLRGRLHPCDVTASLPIKVERELSMNTHIII